MSTEAGWLETLKTQLTDLMNKLIVIDCLFSVGCGQKSHQSVFIWHPFSWHYVYMCGLFLTQNEFHAVKDVFLEIFWCRGLTICTVVDSSCLKCSIVSSDVRELDCEGTIFCGQVATVKCTWISMATVCLSPVYFSMKWVGEILHLRCPSLYRHYHCFS